MNRKIISPLLDIFGVPVGWAALVGYWNEWKGEIIFVLVLVLLIARLYFYIDKSLHEARVRKWEFKQRQKKDNEKPTVRNDNPETK
jgi:hypothetical protein